MEEAKIEHLKGLSVINISCLNTILTMKMPTKSFLILKLIGY